MPKKEIPKTFRVDEDFDRWMSRTVTDLDCNLSDLVRTALLIAVPLIQECPSIMRMLALQDFKSQSD